MIEAFHFLRPMLLWVLLLLPFALRFIKLSTTRDNHWQKHIDSHLLSAMLEQPKQDAPRKKVSKLIVICALSLLVVAASGPSWRQTPQPAIQPTDNMVVIIDLSLSMLSEDTAPSRLVRAKQKLIDLLSQRDGGSTALIAFSGDSFVVTPLTDDIRTIEANLKALDPLIMPVIGSRPDLAIDQAIDLLSAKAADRGQIVIITDGVASHQAEKINKALSKRNLGLNVLAVGTKEGGPIQLPDNRGYLKDQGSVVIAKTDFDALERLAKDNDGAFSQLTLDDSDLQRFASLGRVDSSSTGQDTDSTQFDQWEDMGYLFLLAALPLCLLSYRQGALLVLALCILPINNELQASTTDEKNDAAPSLEGTQQGFTFADLWKTRDQQAQNLVNNGAYQQAAKLYESEQHRADALYQSGEYEQAAALYNNERTANAHFNRGNSLAKFGKLEEALVAYDAALGMQDNFQAAIENRALVQSLLDQAQQQNQDHNQDGEPSEGDQSQSNDSDQDTNQDSQQNSNQDQNQQDQDASQGDEQQNSNEPNKQNDDNTEQKTEQSNEQKDEQESEDKNASPSNTDDIKEQNEALSEQGQQNDQTPEGEQADALTEAQQQALDALNDKDVTASDKQAAMQELEGLTDEEQRSFEQWMRRVPDDPSGLLRRKFEQQARERQRQPAPEEPLW